MKPIYHPSFNTVAKATIVGGLLLVAGLLGLAYAYQRSSYANRVDMAVQQPVPFSHKHHVSGLGIECLYCHTTVEESPFAGIPSTKVCMSCHSQIWTNAALLQPIRDSWATETPVQWTRVHDLGKFAYFNHSIHVNKGVGCETCHGRVDQMPLMWKENSLRMEWCIQCHKAPEKHLRPKSEVYTMGYVPAEPQEVLGPRLMEQYGIQKTNLTNCSTCHR